jgi:predicted PurR-regulated permease PerM
VVDDRDGAPRRREWRLTGIIFFGLIALLVLWAAFRIIWPFLTPILLAAILVTLTFHLFERLRVRFHNRSAPAAIVMLLGITFLLVIPFFLIVMLLVQQANTLIQHLQTGEAQQILARMDPSMHLQWLHRWVPGFDPASVSPQRLILPLLRDIPGWVARNGGALLGGLAGVLIGFFLMLLAAYFFYVEGQSIMTELATLSPLPERYDREFATRFKDVIDATFRGHVVTGLAQGIASTIGMLIAGVPGALFWGAVATVMSLLPFVGAAAVWIPAAIYLFVSAAMGHIGYWHAIFLTLWGSVVISVIDNVLRPWVMKGKSQLPAIPLLFSVLGGLQTFGFVGLVIGPLVFSLLMSIIDIYKRSLRIAPTAGDVA